jgi:DNA-binding MarR family transcriptional regulator
MSSPTRQLHDALFDLVGLLNRAGPDEALMRAAGVSLDQALFPLLVRIERKGPIGVVDLADLAGRDYSTVSRQVAKLEALGLVERRPGRTDRRVNEAVVSARGRTITDALDATRERAAHRLFASWSEHDQRELVRLIRRFADDAMAASRFNDLDTDDDIGPPDRKERATKGSGGTP